MLGLLLAVCVGVAEAGCTNVVMIGVDTLRADHLGCYGYDKGTSPTVDNIAEEGVLFENAMAPRGLTLPSLASVMTSLYPVSHGVRWNKHELSGEHASLAGVLKAKRYACGAFSANELTWKQKWAGFDTFGEVTDDELTPLAVDWLEEHRDGPFFLWLFYYAPHMPYIPPREHGARFDPEYDGTVTEDEQGEVLQNITLKQTELPREELDKILALYDGEVSYADSLIRPVLDTLRKLGLDDNTLVVFFADHGEELYDHHCYFYHIASIHGSVLHVPLIFKLPGVVPKGVRRKTLVELIDVAPTILDILGLEAPCAFQGRSLYPLFEGRALPARPAFAEYDTTMLSIRTDRHYYVYNPRGIQPPWINHEFLRGRTGVQHLDYKVDELYDVVADPKEASNIAAANPDVVRALQAKLTEWQRKYEWVLGEPSNAAVLAELAEKMNALNYLTD